MFSIGEFSKITGMTVKTLRFYHEQGLLTPSCIDDESGYRFYDRTKIEKARIITYLRGLEFSLGEIAEILKNDAQDARLLEVMERQRAQIGEKIRRFRKVAQSLDQFIAEEREVRKTMAELSLEIQEKIVQPMFIAGVRMKGRYADSGKGFSQIGKRFGRHICGKCFLLHYDNEYKEDDADFEACMPIRKGHAADGISVRELPGGRCVCLLHKGPYEQLGRSYAKILTYIQDKGYHAVVPTREVYLKGPGMIFRGNPRNYVTEIQILVQDG